MPDTPSSLDVVPNPDPTRLTSQALYREISALSVAIDKDITALRREMPMSLAAIEARLAGMDEAIKLLQTIMDRFPAEVDVKVSHLEAKHAEKFRTVDVQFESVQIQFKERDERTLASKTASDTAVSAALQAQKEAAGEQAKSFKESIDKSENGTLERIKAQEVLLATSTKGLDDKITGQSKGLDDKIIAIDKRMDRFEGAALGVAAQTVTQQTATTDTRGGNQFMLALVMGAVSIAGLVILLIREFAH